MAEHHERAILSFIDGARDRGALGVVVVGSVARGTERVDSDVDVYEVVDDESFEAAIAGDTVASVDTTRADWPGGYLDIKLVSRALLDRAATDADDATRASLIAARVAFDPFDDLELKIRAITRPGPAYFSDRVRAFSAQFALHADYFLRHGREKGDAMLARSAAVHAASAAGRIALAEREVLSRGPKYMLEQLRQCGYDELAAAMSRLVDTCSAEAIEQVRAAVPALAAAGPAITDEALSRYITDNEWAWLTGHPPPEYR